MTVVSSRILYISYDGVLEPLGESQVIGYLEQLAQGWSITLLSFEKPRDLADAVRRRAMMERLKAAGIRWIPKRYHHRPYVPAKLFDVMVAVLAGLRWSFDPASGGRLIHARGYIPSLMALAIAAVRPARFLFDMRGFWADERVDAGQWSRQGRTYRAVKRWERRFFERADAIVSLTHDGIRASAAFGYRLRPATIVTVIPTCVDLDRFRPGPKDHAWVDRLGLDGRLIVGSVGSMTGWYLREEMLQYLSLLVHRFDRARALIVTRDDHAAIRTEARAAGLSDESLVLVSADFDEMPSLVRLLDLGVLFLRDDAVSNRARASTRLGEMLASGVPVVINRSGGDASALIESERTGIVLPDVHRGTLDASLAAVRDVLADPAIRDRCRSAAARVFDLRSGAARYGELYTKLLGHETVREAAHPSVIAR